MRINRETLLKLARETVSQRTRKDRSILAVYLCGALLEDDYLLGGTGDIDIIFIHFDRVEPEREIVRLNDDVHMDIAHHSQKDYLQTKRLRLHPWLGPTIFNCQTLYDPQHIMDFTQASVRGQFNQPENVLGRAGSQAEHARQIWVGLMQQKETSGYEPVMSYLKALEHAANAIALISGAPLTERKLLMNFRKRAAAVGQPGLCDGLVGLLGGAEVDGEEIHSWLPAWDAAFIPLPEEKTPPRLHPARHNYYLKAFETLLTKDEPRHVLWPLINTWTLAMKISQGENSEGWKTACTKLGLQGAGFSEKVEALDSYLDLVEETLDNWAQANGVET